MNFLNAFTGIFASAILIKYAIKIVIVLIIFYLCPKFIKIVQRMFDRIARARHLDELLISFLSSVIAAVMYVVMFYIVVAILGFKATSLITLLGTAGLAVGLALQGSLSNLAGGVLILFFKPFSKGDGILVNGIEGEVLNIQMIYTRIRTYDNQVVIIPNGQLANSPVTNFSINEERRLSLIFQASYDDDVKKVLSILNEIANNEERIIKDRQVLIKLDSHGESALNYLFRVWTKKEDYHNVKFDLMEKVREEFLKNNIEIPYRKIDIYNK